VLIRSVRDVLMMEQAKNDIFAADSTSVLMADSLRKDFFFFFESSLGYKQILIFAYLAIRKP
jgi:hypothetical protein